MQLEIEQNALRREKDDASRERLHKIERDLANLKEKAAVFKAAWQNEKAAINAISILNSQLEEARQQQESAQRAGDLNLASKIQYGRIPDLRRKLDAAQKDFAGRQGARLLSEEVTPEDIARVVAAWSGVPVSRLLEGEREKLLQMEQRLSRRVVGQAEAIAAVANAVRRARGGLQDPNRPLGSFIFLGPTGVGKTEMARTLANFLFGSEKSLIRFDMSEFMEKHSVSKLIGSPPGYVGYEEGGQLTERVRRSPYSVVLLDEIEKAHPDVFNILLQVFEDGQLTDGLGNTVDFKNTIVVMTSNIGAKHLQKREGLGFQSSNENMVLDKMEELVKGEVKRTFNPEFLNRLDEVIIFTSLTNTDLMQIMELLVQQMNANLVHKAITLSVTDGAKQWIIDKTASERTYGARPLRRALQRFVEDPLSEALIAGGITQRPAFLEVYLENNQLFYRSISPDGPDDSEEKSAGLALSTA